VCVDRTVIFQRKHSNEVIDARGLNPCIHRCPRAGGGRGAIDFRDVPVYMHADIRTDRFQGRMLLGRCGSTGVGGGGGLKFGGM
jgi:hypothetical protein